jgi:hypothetical protein
LDTTQSLLKVLCQCPLLNKLDIEFTSVSSSELVTLLSQSSVVDLSNLLILSLRGWEPIIRVILAKWTSPKLESMCLYLYPARPEQDTAYSQMQAPRFEYLKFIEIAGFAVFPSILRWISAPQLVHLKNEVSLQSFYIGVNWSLPANLTPPTLSEPHTPRVLKHLSPEYKSLSMVLGLLDPSKLEELDLTIKISTFRHSIAPRINR